MVAGGSIRGIEAVLRGDVEHAFHPGGGLHHAMPDRASGFCIYDDPALAIARARRDGLRVLYVDLDVHHGDGVQAIHWDDPGVLTLSFHESGRYLFPGTGGVGELGEGAAAGTSVNVPLEPETGEGAWLAAVQVLLPELAAAFGPDLIVSQHGADTHAWDPLAHLRVTTTAMGEAARLVDRVAHRHARRTLAGDRWRRLRRVPGRATELEPRLAGGGASRGPGRRRPWRGASAGQPRPRATGRRHSPRRSRMPRTRASRWTRRRPWPRPAGSRRSGSCGGLSCRGSCRSRGIAAGGIRSRRFRTPGLVASRRRRAADGPQDHPSRRRDVGATQPGAACRGAVRPDCRVRPHPSGHRRRRDRDGCGRGERRSSASRSPGPTDDHGRRELLALGVAPSFRRQGLGTALLEACVAAAAPAPRDTPPTSPSPSAIPIEPLDRALRSTIARRLLERTGFDIRASDADLPRADPDAFRAVRPARSAP